MQEKKLWIAVLLRGVFDVHRIGDRNSPQIRRSARSWLSDTSSHEIGSFNFICDILMFDPPTVRRRILKQKPEEVRLSIKASPRFSGVSLRAPLTPFKSTPPRCALENADFFRTFGHSGRKIALIRTPSSLNPSRFKKFFKRLCPLLQVKSFHFRRSEWLI